MTKKQEIKKLSRKRTFFTLGLVAIWACLIAFAFVAAGDPPWLKNLMSAGHGDESLGYKTYGDNYLCQGNYPMAIAQYLRALEINPEYVGAMANLAMAYNYAGKSEEGLKLLNTALKIKSARPEPLYFNMGELLASQGKNNKAIEYYLKAIDSEVEFNLLYRRLANLYLETGQIDLARQTFENLLQIQTDPKTPYLNMVRTSLALYENDPENETILRQMLRSDLKDSDLNNYDLEFIRQINQSNKQILQTHTALGKVYLAQGDTALAMEQFRLSQQGGLPIDGRGQGSEAMTNR